MKAFIHPTALLEEGVAVGNHSSVWDNVHIRRNTVLGEHCVVGEKTHISYDVKVGNFVKINAFVYICTAVVIEDGVMISAGCIFTNDRFPRAANSNLTGLRTSDPDEHTRPTVVRSGATLGAGSIIGCDLSIGRFAMIGMGSVVTKSVPDFHLVIGSPARFAGVVCRCGEPIFRPNEDVGRNFVLADNRYRCPVCGLEYEARDGLVIELSQPESLKP